MKTERRNLARVKLNKLSCIQFGTDNSGVVLNLSEDGLSFQAAAPVQVESKNFWLMRPPNPRIEVTGELSWLDRTNRVGGLRFTDPTEEAKELVSAWLAESTPEPFRKPKNVGDPILDEPSISIFQQHFARPIAAGIVIVIFVIVGLFIFKVYQRQHDESLRSGEELGLTSGTPLSPLGSTPSFPRTFSATEGASITAADRAAPKIGAQSSQIVDTVEPGQSELKFAQQYLSGARVIQNSEAAAQWFWAAVKKGNTTAEVALAELYLSGDGVTKNCEQARILLVAAAKKGSALATQKLQQMPTQGCS
jgi:hypothetical protein